jgi:DinB superfamily
METLAQLQRLINEIPPRLEKLSGDAGCKPAPNQWSPKEELGHLLDSAANNHQRIVRVQFEDGLKMPGYQQEQWVAVHGYQQREWRELIALWRSLNQQLLAAASAVPENAWLNKGTVANSDPMTLQFVFEDYIQHMLHHMKHIGIAIDDL